MDREIESHRRSPFLIKEFSLSLFLLVTLTVLFSAQGVAQESADVQAIVLDGGTLSSMIQSNTVLYAALLTLSILGLLSTLWGMSLRTALSDTTKNLKARDENFQQLLNYQIDLIVKVDSEHRVIYASPSFCEMFGVELEDILGKAWSPTMHEEDIPFGRAQMKKITDPPYIVTIPLRSLVDGKWKWFEWRNRAIIDNNGELEGIIGVGRDIDERKTVEEELVQLGLIVASSSDMLATLSKDFVYLNANDAFAQAFNMTRDEIIGCTTAEIFGEDLFNQTLRPRVERCLNGEDVRIQTWTSFPAHGELYVDVSYIASRNSQSDAAFTINIRDITALKRSEDERLLLERQVQHSQKLESLGVLAGGIAHDFNNILAAILGHAELALVDVGESNPARKNLREIVNGSNRAADLTRQMLAYSGRGDFLIESLDLTEVLREMASLLSSSIPTAVSLDLDLNSSIPTIQGDRAQIQQIAMNLITNAADAIGEEHGTITLSSGLIDCDENDLLANVSHPKSESERPAPGQYAYIKVQDNGCGMDEATQARLFESFFSTKFTGRGLGMAAVLGIVHGHRAVITLDSEPGIGSTFRIMFRTEVSMNQSLSTPNTTQDSVLLPSEHTILVIDDDDAVRSVTTDILRRLNHEVLTAHDGLEGIRVYTEHQNLVDIVLLDLSMPQMGGVECYEKLVEVNENVRVIIMSGFTEEDTSMRFSGDRPIEYLQKPFSTKGLLQKLESFSAR